MKWFEHQTDDKDQLEARLIRKRFGNEGWGVWQNLMEEIGKNMGNTNVEEWGCVAKEHTMKSLAEACYCTIEYFNEFVSYCDEMTILSRKNDRLFSPFVLLRMNEYAARIKSKTERSKDKSENKNPETNDNTKIPYNTKTSDTTEIIASQHNTTQHITTQLLNTGKANACPEDSQSLCKAETEDKPKDIGPNRPAGVQDHVVISSPETKRKGAKSISEILTDRSVSNPSTISNETQSRSGISRSWQEKAFRYADKLDILLNESNKSRWLKVFKQASEGRNIGNLEKAYSYLSDRQGELSTNEKLKMFFYIYENGLTKGGRSV